MSVDPSSLELRVRDLEDVLDAVRRQSEEQATEAIKWRGEAKRLLRETQRQAKDIAHLQNANDALRAELRRK